MGGKIPGSFVKRPPKWKHIGYDQAGNKAYEGRSENDSGILIALVSQDQVEVDKKLWHVSISHRDKDNQPDRLPTWDEMKSAKYQLIPADVPMVLIFPRKTVEYVNIYPTCLHL